MKYLAVILITLVAGCECLELEIPNMIAGGSKNISKLTDLLSHI